MYGVGKYFLHLGRSVLQSRVLMQNKDKMKESFYLPCALEKGQRLKELNRKN